jgi:hypothetical protein
MSNGMSRMFTGFLLFAVDVAAQPLVPNGCQLPFAAISVPHPIDTSCTVTGKPSSPQRPSSKTPLRITSVLRALPRLSLRSNSLTCR